MTDRLRAALANYRWLVKKKTEAQQGHFGADVCKAIDREMTVARRHIARVQREAESVKRYQYDPRAHIAGTLAGAAPPWMWTWSRDPFGELTFNLWGTTQEDEYVPPPRQMRRRHLAY